MSGGASPAVRRAAFETDGTSDGRL